MNYIPHTEEQIKEMLKSIGVSDLKELFNDVPDNIRLNENLNLGQSHSELELLKLFNNISKKNYNTEELVSFKGGGCYDHFVPSAIDYLANRAEFYTAYTPYQPEVSQGTLQAIYEYQTFICILTGMDITNASLYDGASAVSEAVLMANRINSKRKVLVSKTVHPDYITTLSTYLVSLDLKLNVIPDKQYVTDIDELSKKIDQDTFAIVLQIPNFFGYIEDVEKIKKILIDKKVLLIICVDPISLGLINSPAYYKADIVVGDGQSLGNYQSFGGPTFGFLATKNTWLRNLPGRIVGKTVDKKGRDAFTLTIQTREQHIRRHRATSNICSNQSLNAFRAAVYCSLLGREGFRKIAKLCFLKSHYLAKKINELDKFSVFFDSPFFKEFVVETNMDIKKINDILLKENIIGGIELGSYYPAFDNHMLIAVTEKRTKEEMDKLVYIFKNID